VLRPRSAPPRLPRFPASSPPPLPLKHPQQPPLVASSSRRAVPDRSPPVPRRNIRRAARASALAEAPSPPVDVRRRQHGNPATGGGEDRARRYPTRLPVRRRRCSRTCPWWRCREGRTARSYWSPPGLKAAATDFEGSEHGAGPAAGRAAATGLNYYGVIEQPLRAGCVPAKTSWSRLSKTDVELLRRNKARTVPAPMRRPPRSRQMSSMPGARGEPGGEGDCLPLGQ
jgi:hypothetical protein